MDSIYQFNAPLCNNAHFPLAKLKGKTILIVNTASKCNFSAQLFALEKLYQHYKNDGFTILAFPCDQFGKNEPLDDIAIKDFYHKHFNITYEVFAKVYVNGPDAHPLFNYLKSHTRGIAQSRAIKWNFTKFLIDGEGQLVARYAPRTKPESLANAVQSCLLKMPKTDSLNSPNLLPSINM